MDMSVAQRSRMDAQNAPIAIVHGGIFVFANQRYLQQFALSSLDELQLIPILDLVVTEEQEVLRKCLRYAEKEMACTGLPQERVFTMKSADGDIFAVAILFECTTFDDEQCIKLSLRLVSNSTILNKIRSIPWSYYFSMAVLLFLFFLPNMLLLNLQINNSLKVYFSPDAASLVAENSAREYFPTDQVMVLMFEGVALYSDGFLTAFNELAHKIENLERVYNVISVTTQDHIAGTADGFMVEPVISIEKLSESHPSKRSEIILEDRFARGALMAENGTALSMIIVPQKTDSSPQRTELMDEIMSIVSEHRLDGYLTAAAGEIPLDVAEFDSMLRDNMIFIPATTLTGLLLIWLLFKRVLALVVSGAVVGVVVSSTIAIYVIAEQPFTLISSITSPLLSALTIAALVHLFNAIQFASQRGYYGKTRVKIALGEVRRPALFTSLTTAAGLASLGASPIPPIATFGLIASCGVMLIFFMVIYVVPQIFVRWDCDVWSAKTGRMSWMDATVRFFCRMGIRYPVHVLGVSLFLLIIGLPQLSTIKVETNLQEFFSPDHEIRKSIDRIDNTLVGTLPIEVFLKSDNLDTFKRPDILRQLKQFQLWAESLSQVDKTISLADYVEDMNWGFHEEDEKFRKIPDDSDLISQYLLIYDGEDMYDLVDQDFKTTLVSLNLNQHNANDITNVIEQIENYLRLNIDSSINWEIVGVGRLFSDLEELLVNGQVYSLLGALMLIFVLMLILWRSFLQSVLCMLPNLSPILLIFIFMGLFGIWLDMATAMIASVAVGIAVDDTIHIFHGFIKRVNQGVMPSVALLRTTALAGRAVLTTTIILSSQFMVLVSSQFVPTQNFGMLTSIGLFAALIFDLLLLPAILIMVYNRKMMQQNQELICQRG